MSEHVLAIGDLAVTPLNAIPRRVKYVGTSEVFLEDNDDRFQGEWVLRSFAEYYGGGSHPLPTDYQARAERAEARVQELEAALGSVLDAAGTVYVDMDFDDCKDWASVLQQGRATLQGTDSNQQPTSTEGIMQDGPDVEAE